MLHRIGRKDFGVCLILFAFRMPCWVSAQDSNDIDASASELRPMIERYTEDQSILRRTVAIPMSEQRLDRMGRFFREWDARLQEIDFNSLSQDGRIDYLLFRNALAYEVRQVTVESEKQREMIPLMPFFRTIVDLEESRRNAAYVDPAEAADRMSGLAEQVIRVQKSVKSEVDQNKKGSVFAKKTVILRAANVCEQMQRTLSRWYGFYHGYDPLFTWWVEEPYKKADEALKTYIAFLRGDVLGIRGGENDGPIIGDPIGREALLGELAHAMIPYTPEELIAAGKREYAWCEAEMIRASEALGYGKDWHSALEHVKTLHVAPGEQPSLILEQALEAITFLEAHDLISVPQLAKETWKMGMMSPERQKVNPFFTGGEVISVSFPTNTMSHEDKLMSMRGNNVHFARATVHHELIPGHHLQFFMTSRYRPYRRIFGTPFWLEGWPLHWEMLLWDLGFPKSPENRIGMLFWRMHRCARIIFSLSFHLGKMTPEECIDLLVKGVGHELANATAEVRRSFAGDYEPLYQCAYMIGGLQMRALYHELVASGRMTDREFHDAVMSENSMPIVLLRAKLTNQPLREDFNADWKFLEK